MDSSNIGSVLDHQRWLLNNGLVNDLAKNNLYLYGSIVHKEVQAVELSIDVANKVVDYNIYIDRILLDKVSKYEKLKQANDIFSLWRLRRLLRKEGNLNFQHVLNSFVKDFCGPKWNATIKLIDISNYTEGFEESNSETRQPNTGDHQFNK
jgi:hypothetical protein